MCALCSVRRENLPRHGEPSSEGDENVADGHVDQEKIIGPSCLKYQFFIVFFRGTSGKLTIRADFLMIRYSSNRFGRMLTANRMCHRRQSASNMKQTPLHSWIILVYCFFLLQARLIYFFDHFSPFSWNSTLRHSFIEIVWIIESFLSVVWMRLEVMTSLRRNGTSSGGSFDMWEYSRELCKSWGRGWGRW